MNKDLDAADKALQSPQTSARNTWFIPSLITLLFVLGGCNGVDRLLNGPTAPPSPPQTLLGGPSKLGNPPEFALTTPLGFERRVFYNYLSASGEVLLPTVSDSLIKVFLKDPAINQWFQLGKTYSGAFWYTQEGSVVHYQGANLGDKVYCIYQYIPKEEL
jgi:hypothetical protein